MILAIGHSARDTFQELHRLGLPMEAKAFSVGARIEHPASLIDRAQYGDFAGHPALARRTTSSPATWKTAGGCTPSACAPAAQSPAPPLKHAI